MQGLFKKVLKGNFTRIPKEYSSELSKMISWMLQTRAEKRPNCVQLMQNPTFMAKLEEFYPETHERVLAKEMELRPELMKTIFFSNRERIMIGDDHM